jgi:hypothetical protein
LKGNLVKRVDQTKKRIEVHPELVPPYPFIHRFQSRLGAWQASAGRDVNQVQLQATDSPAVSNPVQLPDGLYRPLEGADASLPVCPLGTVVRQRPDEFDLARSEKLHQMPVGGFEQNRRIAAHDQPFSQPGHFVNQPS